nr:uncharacterized protein LOC115258926 [Aedes albopictus]
MAEQSLRDEITRLQGELQAARTAATNVNEFAAGGAQLEAQFALTGITREETRYYHVLAAIDSEILACCSDIIRDPPPAGQYTAIKDRITKEYSTSEQNRMQQLLRGCELGDRKPSQLLREMRDLARDVITDDKVIKSLWMQQLPETTQAVLKVTEDTLQLPQLAEQADKLADVTRSRIASSAVAAPHDKMVFDLAELRAEIAELSSEIAAFRQARGRSRNRSFSRQQGTRSASRDQHPYCYYHRRFGSAAKNCREPCQFKPKN